MENTLYNYIECNITISINDVAYYGELGSTGSENSFYLILNKGTERIFFNTKKLDFYKVDTNDFVDFNTKKLEKEKLKEKLFKEQIEKSIKFTISVDDFNPFE